MSFWDIFIEHDGKWVQIAHFYSSSDAWNFAMHLSDFGANWKCHKNGVNVGRNF